MSTPVLWQFRFSHYNEKARWALDWKGIPHVRESLVPGLHVARVMWMTRQKAVPVLVMDGRTIHDSTRIIAALEEHKPDPALYPADPAARRRALEIEEWFDEELGAQIRQAFFWEVLPHTDAAVGALTLGAGAGTKAMYRALFPVVRAVMKMDMGIDAATAERGRERVRIALDRIAAERQPSGYLVGDSFTVADLTAAALLSPLVMPPEFPYPPPVALPPGVAAFRGALAEHPGFTWVSEMYRRHRGRSAEIAA